jgi:ankyrin repeat protein
MSIEGDIKDLSLSMDYDEFLACARYGDYEDVKEFLETVRNMNILYKDKFGNTALHMASANGHKGKKD